MMLHQRKATTPAQEGVLPVTEKKVRYESDFRSHITSNKSGLSVDETISHDNKLGFGISEKRLDNNQSHSVSMKGLPYVSG